ncbi:MAG: pitrilysin family protein [Patescibacteria group bacterium]|nr:pitrilysin family protein [Patescibacteria group bacterium]
MYEFVVSSYFMHFKKTILKNGLRVVMAPMKDTNTVTVIVSASVGSKYETKKTNGISHFLEHMFFKGTKKRPRTEDISGALDSVGGEYNAFTGKEQTAYFAKVDVRHFDLALDVVSDIYLNSKLEEKEIEKERGVILQELNMYEDTPVVQIGDVFEEILYGDQPAGWEIIGTKENIRNLGRRDFVEYLRKNYTAPNTVVAVTGNFGGIGERGVIGKIRDIFLKMSKKANGKKSRVIESQSAPRIKIKHKKTDQAHLILGFRAYDMFHPDRFALSILANILGGTMSSRLFLSVRERLGLAYYISASYESYTDSGYLAVKAGVGTEREKIEKAVKTIIGEIRKIRDKKVSWRELQKAKDNLRGKMALSLESSDEVAAFLAGQELMKRKIETPDQILARVDKVSADDIMRVARKIFANEKLNLALIGPVENSKYLERILNL